MAATLATADVQDNITMMDDDPIDNSEAALAEREVMDLWWLTSHRGRAGSPEAYAFDWS